MKKKREFLLLSVFLAQTEKKERYERSFAEKDFHFE